MTLLVLFRYSDGSYWETHNQWSLTGINRNAYLLARPRLRIRDFFAKPDLKGNTGLLQIEAEVLNEDNHTEDIVVEAKILDAKTRMVLVSGQNKLQADGSSVKKTSISLQLKNATPGRMKFHTAMTFWSILRQMKGRSLKALFAKRPSIIYLIKTASHSMAKKFCLRVWQPTNFIWSMATCSINNGLTMTWMS